MIDKKQPSNRQLKIGQQIRFLVSSLLIKEDFLFENFDRILLDRGQFLILLPCKYLLPIKRSKEFL